MKWGRWWEVQREKGDRKMPDGREQYLVGQDIIDHTRSTIMEETRETTKIRVA
jgi:hypothetical protein